MAAASWIKYTYLAHFARPKSDRQLYRLVKRGRVCRIVEVGISNIARSTALIAAAQRFAGEVKVCYTGLDFFEARSEGLPKLFLKQAYQQLQATGAQVRLAPGPAAQSIASIANAHKDTDLFLISTLVTDADLVRVWFYVPRMLNAKSTVLRAVTDANGETSYTQISVAKIGEWAASQGVTRRAA